MSVPPLRHLLAATVLMLLTFPLHANPLLPGGSVSPDIFPNPGSTPPLLGDITGTFDFGSGFTGSYEEAVLVDPFGVTCSGCLDFAFAVNNSSASWALFSLQLARFNGYTTDVGYVMNSGGNVDPVSITRGPVGGNISFQFNTPTILLPGFSSDFLVVATNATGFDTGGVIAIIGSNGPGSIFNGQIRDGIFEPTFVPEPSTMVLLSLGLSAVAAFRKRQS